LAPDGREDAEVRLHVLQLSASHAVGHRSELVVRCVDATHVRCRPGRHPRSGAAVDARVRHWLHLRGLSPWQRHCRGPERATSASWGPFGLPTAAAGPLAGWETMGAAAALALIYCGRAIGDLGASPKADMHSAGTAADTRSKDRPRGCEEPAGADQPKHVGGRVSRAGGQGKRRSLPVGLAAIPRALPSSCFSSHLELKRVGCLIGHGLYSG
jgi:hypothetical protein